jgi:hypothetical protein
MYLDYRRHREEQVVRQSGVPCACGQRLWTREQVREPGRRRFMCLACRTVLNVPADLSKAESPKPLKASRQRVELKRLSTTGNSKHNH